MIDSSTENKSEENSLVSKSQKILSSSLNIQDDEPAQCLNDTEETEPLSHNKLTQFVEQNKNFEIVSQIVKPDLKKRYHLELIQQRDNKNKKKHSKSVRRCRLNKVSKDFYMCERADVPEEDLIYNSINIGK